MTARTKTIHNSYARTFGGAKKAAALLFSLDKDYAQRLLEHLSHDERKKIVQAARNLHGLKVKDIGMLVDEFTRVYTDSADFDSTPDNIKELFSGYLSDEEFEGIFGSYHEATPVWEELNEVESSEIAKYLAAEHPQTVAYLLSQFDPVIAADVAGQLPGELRNEALRRMLRIGEVHPRIRQSIEVVLREDLMPTEFVKADSADPIGVMSEILNGLSKEAVDDVIGDLQNYFPEEANKIKSKLFAFEDFGTLSKEARVVVMDKISTEQVILALKNCESAIADAALEALPDRARRMVENELSLGVKSKPADIDGARKLIQRTVLKLAEDGEIKIPKVQQEPENTE
ncbi:MAG: flagellar motor switch protein FliG [Hyphomicrobiales bacterium]|nr:flagellar motor switch protein FliG [Hyphomicrobiales bacterium]